MGLRFLKIELTGKCSLRCKHCYGAFPSDHTLPQEKVREIIDQAVGIFDCLIFSGGEPFMHPHLLDLVRHAEKKLFSVHITTSGVGVTARKIAHLPSNAILVFGIDGIGPAHDEYRGEAGSYQKILAALARARHKPLEIITTLWKGNLHQLDQIADLGKDYGAAIHFNALVPVGRAHENRGILLNAKENKQTVRTLTRLRQSFGTLYTDLYKITARDRREGIDLFCRGRLSIDPRGEVHPSEFLRGVRMGNIFEEELPGIIERARAHPLIHAREQGFKGHIPLELSNHFDYHTEVCHRLAGLISGDT
jgi:MoaA/NifB/PqqE/SkfB family radical SAM enzyme